MATRKEDRKPSTVQFLATARDLEIETIRRCEKIPTRYTLTLANKLIQLSIDGYVNLKSANSVFPKRQCQVRERLSYIDAAWCNYQSLISQIDIVKGLFPNLYSDNVLINWMKMLEDEFTLLRGLKDSDVQRFKDLPE